MALHAIVSPDLTASLGHEPELTHGSVDGRPVYLMWRHGAVDHVAGWAVDEEPNIRAGG